jgi:hypothetical protein
MTRVWRQLLVGCLLSGSDAVCPSDSSSAECSLDMPFSFDSVQGFMHSQNMQQVSWSPEALSVIVKYPLVTIEKGHGGFLGLGASSMAEEKIVAACNQIKAAAVEAGTDTKAVYYWNANQNWWHFHSADLGTDHPDWFLYKADGTHYLKNSAYPLKYFNFSVDAMRESWKENCLAATRSGCDGCFIDNSDHKGTQMRSWLGRGDVEVRESIVGLEEEMSR